MIDFGLQAGGNQSSEAILKLWNEFLEVFYDDESLSGYFSGLDGFQIVFRVSEGDCDFKHDGPDKLRQLIKNRLLTIDLVIPENRWLGQPNDIFSAYVIDGVESCFKLLFEEALRLEVLVEPDKLRSDFYQGLNTIRARI